MIENTEIEELIPVYVESPTLVKVIDYMNYFANDHVNPTVIEWPLRSNDLVAAGVSEWEAKYIDIPSNDEYGEYLALKKAANYLIMEPLIDLVNAKIASMTKELTDSPYGHLKIRFRIEGEQKTFKQHHLGWLTTCHLTGSFPKPVLFLENGQGVMWLQEIKRSNRFISRGETGVNANRYVGYGTDTSDQRNSTRNYVVDFWIVEDTWNIKNTDAEKERLRRAHIVEAHVSQCSVYSQERETKKDRLLRGGKRAGQSFASLFATPVILTAAIGSFVGGAIGGVIAGPLNGAIVAGGNTYDAIEGPVGLVAGGVAGVVGAGVGLAAGPVGFGAYAAYEGGDATAKYFYGDQKKTDEERNANMNVQMAPVNQRIRL